MRISGDLGSGNVFLKYTASPCLFSLFNLTSKIRGQEPAKPISIPDLQIEYLKEERIVIPTVTVSRGLQFSHSLEILTILFMGGRASRE
jgi:hypothetical protein